MTDAQRAALVGMMQAILAVDGCPRNIRGRATILLARLQGTDPLEAFLRSFRR